MYSRRESEYSSHMSSTDERESPDKSVIVEEEASLGDGLPQPPTEIFKGQDLLRSDTPETYLTDIADKPDITLFCDECRLFIDIRQLKHHRAFHSALQTLHYKGTHMPETSEQLLKKRNAVLRKMKKEATLEKPIEPKHIQQVNDAYELLKSVLEDTFEACRQVTETVDTSCRAMALNCSPDCVYALGMCSSANSRWKSEMEDTKVYQDSFGENPSKCYVGLFDGYHGRFSAEVAASLLHKMLLHELMKFDASLKLGPAQEFDANADISHHSFVFGSGASLDGQAQRGGTAEQSTPAEVDTPTAGKSGGEAVTVIQPDDDELTQRIIQLCEDKYQKLLEELPPTPKSSRSVSSKSQSQRCRHPDEEKIMQAFDKSYHLLDILLSYGKDEWSKVRWSGCSALSMVIESTEAESREQTQGEGSSHRQKGGKDNKDTARLADPPVEKGYIHLANAGDTRALLVRGNRTYRISKDHTPSSSKERERVVRDGGSLTTSEMDCRVNGVLATTRGLGNHGDPGLKKCVLVDPHTCSVQIDQYAQFIVMATVGVWEVLSDQEVGSLLMRMLPCNQIPPPSKTSSTLGHLLDMGPDPHTPKTPIADADATSSKKKVTMETDHEHGAKSQEKGSTDAGVSEKALPSDEAAEGLRIAADLKTEAGSHIGDWEDPNPKLMVCGDQDMVTLPVHSQLDLASGRTVEDKRRDLARSMAEHIVQAALLAGCRNNITVMVALLPGCGI
ncbi:protein phosphatase 2C-like domain-containing protein 1 [Babylonia areolata]|uniref:protein phosphatase 2C-like domain-containing protein 1 n=1 Tax=Babylonia areolata TaxID=304850 RepID=UPI003FD1E08A